MAAGGIASGSRLFSKVLRPQSSDVQAAAMWGVAAATGALWLIQVSGSLEGFKKWCFEVEAMKEEVIASSNYLS
ncbi:hypothetical protein L484_018798 [Morus notabilis]|uniref:Uncharacterized protein n=1 Tax=Morus notabilis TaxID=981085 RepID=W9QW84_9ROSA|nr:hypothetical protein L484_018798 [Morus notabilis]